MLGSRGVDASLIDDIVQEVAVRALDKRVPFTDPADLYRWAATTARRLHIDHLRYDCRTTYDDALVAVADGTDVAHAAERRVALGHVLRAMAGMRPGERDAILDSLEDREARTSQALVRRHRARATLKKAVGGMLTWVTVTRLRVRTMAPAIRDVSVVAALAPALAIGTGSLLPSAPETQRRPVVTAPAPRPAVERPAIPKARPAGERAAPQPAARQVRAARKAPVPAARPARDPGYRKTGNVGGFVDVYERSPQPKDPLVCVNREDDPLLCARHPRDLDPPGRSD